MACALTRCHAPTSIVASPITIPRNLPRTWRVKYMPTFDHVLYATFTNFIYPHMLMYPRRINETNKLPGLSNTRLLHTRISSGSTFFYYTPNMLQSFLTKDKEERRWCRKWRPWRWRDTSWTGRSSKLWGRKEGERTCRDLGGRGQLRRWRWGWI